MEKQTPAQVIADETMVELTRLAGKFGVTVNHLIRVTADRYPINVVRLGKPLPPNLKQRLQDVAEGRATLAELSRDWGIKVATVPPSVVHGHVEESWVRLWKAVRLMRVGTAQRNRQLNQVTLLPSRLTAQ